MNTVRLKFLGGIGTVTGSCTLMEYKTNDETHYFLIDAGMYQGEGEDTLETREKVLKRYAGKIEIMFITHAHLDHIGLLPELREWGFDGKIYGTKATIELMKVMLEDMLKIKGLPSLQIQKIMKKFKFYAVDKNRGENTFKGFGRQYSTIAHNFGVSILRSSHILGSCVWLFRWCENEHEKDNVPKEEWKYIYFTGDIGPGRKEFHTNILFKGHQLPFSNNPEKTVIMESTYGETVRTKRDNVYQEKIAKLSEIILTNMQNNRSILIPVFALDRAQQILVDLYNVTRFEVWNEKSSKLLWEDILLQEGKSNIDDLFFNKTEDELIELINRYLPEKTKGTKGKQISGILFQNLLPEDEIKLRKRLNRELNHTRGDKKITFPSITIASPLIEKINKIYIENLTDDVGPPSRQEDGKYDFNYKYLSDEFLREFNLNDESISREQKNKIKTILEKCFNVRKKGNITVSASGMCDHGAVVGLLEKHLADENSTVILTGYQAKDTNGFLLKNYSEGKYNEDDKEKNRLSLGKTELRLSEIRCKIENLSEYYSGHADQRQLVNYIIEPHKTATTVLLNHGTETARKSLKEALDQEDKENLLVFLPEFNKWFNVGSKEHEEDETEEENEIIDFETIQQYNNIHVDGLHIYFPLGYDETKMRNIIEHIQKM